MSTPNKKLQLVAPQGARRTNQNVPSRRKRRNNRRGNPRSPPQSQPAFVLSACALSYAQAKLDPFNHDQQELPCIPDLLDLPSMKVGVLQRGVFSVGASHGFVMVSPNFNGSDVVTSVSSTSSWVNNRTANSIAEANTVLGYGIRFPFAVGAVRNHRPVAGALRVRYIGPEQTRGGQLCMYVSNSDSAAMNGAPMGTYLTVPEMVHFPVTRKWSTIAWNPAYADAYAFSTLDHSLTASFVLGCNLQAIASGEGGNEFEWEFISYHEFTSYGTNTVPNTTKSHTDLPGMSMLRDFISSTAVGNVGKQAFQSFLGFAKSQAAAAVISHFGRSPAATMLAWR